MANYERAPFRGYEAGDFGKRGIQIKPFSFVDINGETAEYWHVTNRVVDLWLDMGLNPSSWAMDTQVGCLGLPLNCFGFEPYPANTQNKGPYDSHANAELAKHAVGNWMTMASKVRCYKSAEDADTDSATHWLNPLTITPDTEEIVVARERLLTPFAVVADSYPAIQIVYGGKTIGYKSTATATDYGDDDPPASFVDVGWASGQGDRIIGICFDWPYEGGSTENVTVRAYIRKNAGATWDATWTLQGIIYPVYSHAGGTLAIGATGATLTDGAWNEWTVPANKFRKGTNYLIFKTSNGSATKYIEWGVDSCTTNIGLKNYRIANAGTTNWDSVKRYFEYYRITRDGNCIETWVKSVTGADLDYDFIGGVLGDTRRAPHMFRQLGTVGPDAPPNYEGFFRRGVKYAACPNRLDNAELGTKTTADTGYVPNASPLNKDISAGLVSGVYRFSRDNKYPYTITVPAGSTWGNFRLSTFDDLYAGGAKPSTAYQSAAGASDTGMGYARGWTDSPCARTGVIAAGSKSPVVKIDYTEMIRDLR